MELRRRLGWSIENHHQNNYSLLMQYRTKIEMLAVQSEVQLHLEQLRQRGLPVPTVQKSHKDWINWDLHKESETGFAESAQKPISKINVS